MKIGCLELIVLSIPFHEVFSHAAHVRAASDAFLIKIVTTSGILAYGEGLVRGYVTGESLSGVRDRLDAIADSIIKHEWTLDSGKIGSDAIESLSAALDLILHSISPIDSKAISDNGLRCALELAILDACLKECNIPLSALFPPEIKEVRYSAIISSGSLRSALFITDRFLQLGLKDFKFKVSSLNDVASVQKIRDRIGPDLSLRLDGNSAFSLEEALTLAAAVRPMSIVALEQVMPRGDLQESVRLRAGSLIPIMADESLVTLSDAAELISAQAVDIFNVRLAKCGGIGPSLAIIKMARKAGIKFQIGCLVGETSILSAAARHLAAYASDCLFVEGSVGTLLLIEDIALPSLRFGEGGLAPLLNGIGLGMNVDEEQVKKFSIQGGKLYSLEAVIDEA